MASFPTTIVDSNYELICTRAKELVSIFKDDYQSKEENPGFKSLDIINIHASTISSSFNKLYENSLGLVEEVQELEQANNELFIEMYGAIGQANEEVKKSTISLYCNQYYQFSSKDLALGKLLYRAEKIAEILSYSIGCAMGRFSLNREGLVYAQSGNGGFDLLDAEGAYIDYPADEDGIIPLTDQEWFRDDATNRFREFVQVVWGEEHLQENLDFVAESLCLNAIKPKKSESALETIRRYLSTQFYKDHLKTYKKRPIYWLFSSGKQKAFECLVYLHRYNEGTLSRMRTEYVTPLLGKYDAYAEQLEKQIETADSTSEANRFKKELDALIKKQVELREFDDKLKHYADMRISLDLDDGVKVNYGKFGDLLADVKAITGSAPEVN
ncbi:class I SAM-dependent DNA methyltransferase [Morganella morganii]|uniref:class I SAM-dependent DNA methyltransferase n=1 Tax=Morganella morganii TaxID=582 RepID=UPI0032AFF2CF